MTGRGGATGSRGGKKASEQARRRYGDGTVFQLSSGLWRAQISAGALPDGSRNRPYVDCEAEEAAHDALLQLRIDKRDGKFQATAPEETGPHTLINDWLTMWLDALKLHAKPRTYTHYKTSVMRLKEKLPGTTMGEMDLDRHLALRMELEADMETKCQTMRPVQRELATLNTAFNAAVPKVIPFNPLVGARRPRYRPAKGTALTTTEADQVMNGSRIARDRFHSLWTSFLILGPREAEFMGMEDDRVDMRRHTFDFAWQLQRLPMKQGAPCDAPDRFDVPRSFEHRPCYRGFAWTRPKSPSSERVQPMGMEVSEAMEHYYAYDHVPNPLGLTWARPKGTPYEANVLLGMFKAALANVGLPEMKIHWSRNTAATRMIEAGLDQELIMKILGQSSTFVTRIYQTIDLSMKEAGMAKVDAMYAAKRGAIPLAKPQPAVAPAALSVDNQALAQVLIAEMLARGLVQVNTAQQDGPVAVPLPLLSAS